jgi:predicted patatin/cPLA2 family phospholipase
MHISRLEKDKSKLVDLYNLGRKDVNARLDALLNFLEK